MRIITVLGISTLVLTAAACGTFGEPATYASLEENCAARGGRLTPTGADTGQVWRDHRCEGGRPVRVTNAAIRGASISTANAAVDRTLLGHTPR